MGSANLAHINPEIITWALKRRSVSPEQIATKQLTATQIRAWETKHALPTHAQAQALADKLRIPLLVFFLSKAPDLELEIPDLRTASGTPDASPSTEFMQVINDALVRQDWYRELEESRAARPRQFVGTFSRNWNVNAVATEIAKALGIEQLRREARSWKEFLEELISRTEHLGILVFRSAVVGNATNRKLSVKEFRGFVLSDALAPVIFINDDDAKAAQTFTLVHELAHIWIGATGISDPNLTKRSFELANAMERFCNSVAAETLVPANDFNSVWDGQRSLAYNLGALAVRYRVSSVVLLIRARELGKISESTFNAEFKSAMDRFREQDKKEQARLEGSKKKQGGNFWASFAIRNSRKFSDLVLSSAKEGHTRFTDAASLLGIGSASFERYLQKLQKST